MLINQIKTFSILSILTMFVLMAGFALGGQIGLTIALVLTLFFNVISYWFSDRIVLRMYNAKEARYSEYKNLNKSFPPSIDSIKIVKKLINEQKK